MPRPLTKLEIFVLRSTLNDYELVHALTAHPKSIYRSVWPGRNAAISGWSREDVVYRPTEDTVFSLMRKPAWKAALHWEPDYLELMRRKDQKHHKVCACCGEFKSLLDFSYYKRNADGRHSYCKKCRANQDRVKRFERIDDYFTRRAA